MPPVFEKSGPSKLIPHLALIKYKVEIGSFRADQKLFQNENQNMLSDLVKMKKNGGLWSTSIYLR